MGFHAFTLDRMSRRGVKTRGCIPRFITASEGSDELYAFKNNV